jgi:RNA polymerase sigma-70 factor (ECF subfamily)
MSTSPELTTSALIAHSGFVRALAERLVGSQDAEDVAQQTWLSALQSPPRRPGDPRPWLATILRNVAAKGLRGRQRRRRREHVAARRENMPSTLDVVEREALLRTLMDAVLALPESSRSTLVMRYYEGLAPRVIAERLDVPIETVRTRLSRGLQSLRQQLDRKHSGDRRSWCFALAALTGLKTTSASLASLGPAAAFTGATWMTTRTLLSTLALAVIGLTWMGWSLLAGGNRPLSSRATPSASIDPMIVGPAQAGAGAAVATRIPEATIATEQQQGLIISGQVTDQAGEPVHGAEIWIVAQQSPFADLPQTSQIAWNYYRGGIFHSDEAGHYSATLSLDTPVLVHLTSRPSYEAQAQEEQWVEAPAQLNFVVDRKPTGSVAFRVRDPAKNEFLENFKVSVRGEQTHFSQRSTSVVLESTLRVENSDGQPLTVVLLDPEFDPPVSREFRLLPGVHQQIDLVLQIDGFTAGSVVNQRGEPLQGATVFFGNQIDARGDEPFKPIDLKRISRRVETDSSGWFELSGQESWVTVYHPGYSSVTVSGESVGNIVLPDLGVIEGIFRDDSGTIQADESVTLDRTRRTQTNAAGFFRFEGVEAGVRGLALSSRARYAVRVEPGQTQRVGLGSHEPEVEFLAPDSSRSMEGVLIGRDQLFRLHELQLQQGRGRLRHVVHGRYYLLTRGAVIGTTDVEGPQASLTLGTSTLRVRAAPGTRIYVVPESADEFLELMAGRFSATIPESGRLDIPQLQEGPHVVGIDRRGRQVAVVVEGSRTNVQLPDGS